ncbi:MAG: S41 family peptidase [Candidatus Ratteibacteria bacterium]|nr:S41 family peptidase [Candidatus Ratteibacteria bacterium]
MKPIRYVLVFFLFFLLIFTIGDIPPRDSIAEEEIYPQLELLAKVIATIQQKHVKEIGTKELINSSIEGMVTSLDPYSQFMTPEIKKEFEVETKGELEGVGMVITLQDNIVMVISPIEDTPAFRAGIESGDKITEIDGEPTKGWSTWKAAQKLRGTPGTKVTIKVFREGEEDLLTFELTREVIHIKSVKDASILSDNIGYIRVTAFREDTFQRLKEAVLELQNKGAKSIIMDLRNNPGGFLESSIQISDLFLPKGALIVYTKGRDEKDEKKYYAQNNSILPATDNIVILVNGGSASASEIVAGALRDNNRAVIIGTKTFGKGSVQSIIEIDKDYSLRLTTAYYYIPRGESIEGKGIAPDIEVEISKAEKKQIKEFIAAGYQKFDIEKDPQIRKAVEYLEGNREQTTENR